MNTEHLLNQVIDYVEVFKALGDPVRLEMLTHMAHNEEVLCVFFEEKMQLSKSLISHHVRILRNARLIQIRREGRYYHYSLLRYVWARFLPGLLQILQDRAPQLPVGDANGGLSTGP